MSSDPLFPINVTVAPVEKNVPVITKSKPEAICVSRMFVLILVTVGEYL